MVDATLTASLDGETLELRLAVENGSTESVEMTFRDGQRAEFVAHDGDTEVWRWSDGRMFTQAITTTRLEPGEQTAFEAGWRDPPAGEYTLQGRVTADGVDASAETTVSV